MTSPNFYGPYPRAVLADGPVAYWRQNDFDPGTSKDLSGHGYDGVMTGSITRDQGSMLPSLDGDSTAYGDSHFGSTPCDIVAPNVSAFEVPAWTLEWWGNHGASGTFCVAQHPGRWRLVISGGSGELYFWVGGSWSLVSSTNGGWSYGSFDGGGSRYMALTFNPWATDGKRVKWFHGPYINPTSGIAPPSTPYAGYGTVDAGQALPGSGSGALVFGNNDGNDTAGKYQEVAFYDYALDPSQLQTHWLAAFLAPTQSDFAGSSVHFLR